MANAYKVIGQVADASANDVTLVADQNGETIISTIVVCNREAAENTFRLAALNSKSIISSDRSVNYPCLKGRGLCKNRIDKSILNLYTTFPIILLNSFEKP